MKFFDVLMYCNGYVSIKIEVYKWHINDDYESYLEFKT